MVSGSEASPQVMGSDWGHLRPVKGSLRALSLRCCPCMCRTLRGSATLNVCPLWCLTCSTLVPALFRGVKGRHQEGGSSLLPSPLNLICLLLLCSISVDFTYPGPASASSPSFLSLGLRVSEETPAPVGNWVLFL